MKPLSITIIVTPSTKQAQVKIVNANKTTEVRSVSEAEAMAKVRDLMAGTRSFSAKTTEQGQPVYIFK